MPGCSQKSGTRPRRGDDPAQAEHRRVGGEHDELAAGRRELEAAIERRSRALARPRSGRASRPAVGEAQRQLGGPRPRDHERSSPASSGSKSTSQIHETSRPSAISSLSATTARRGGEPVEQRPHRLVGAGRVLDQQHQQALVVDRDPLEAAERGHEPLETLRDLRERRPERTCDRRRCGRVVDVVEAREREPNPRRARRGDEREVRALEALAARSRVPPPRAAAARGAAGGAAPVAQMADIGRRVLVRRAAVEAVLRVGRVLERAARACAGRRARRRSCAGGRGRASPSIGSSALTTRSASGSAATALRQRSATSSSSP